jgi:hypothetical protein
VNFRLKKRRRKLFLILFYINLNQGIVIGENLAAGYEKWAHVLSSWMSESRHFIYKSTSANDNLLAGHYTQMIYSSASRIGCGFAQCSNTTYDRYFVCYYGEMVNLCFF